MTYIVNNIELLFKKKLEFMHIKLAFIYHVYLTL